MNLKKKYIIILFNFDSIPRIKYMIFYSLNTDEIHLNRFII